MQRLKREREEEQRQNDDDDEDAIGGMFKVAANKQLDLHSDKENRDLNENYMFEEYGDETRDWSIDENKDLIKNCFVTGKWKASEDAEELLRLDDLSDNDEEVFGDFEDLETGEKHIGKKTIPMDESEAEDDEDDDGDGEDAQTNEASRKRKMTRVEESNLTKTELMAKKMKLKAQFDADYDNTDDNGRITGDHQYYEELN